MELIIITIITIIAYITGSKIEKSHYKDIEKREDSLLYYPYVVDDFAVETSNVARTEFVHGSCVIAADRFKVFMGGILSIFGGRISAYETLTDRARREAILRMREQAGPADMVVCTRIQFSEVGVSQVEALAYGTAVFLKK